MKSLITSLYLLANSPQKLAHYHGLNLPDKETLPNFLGIGAQKAGTTWLHQNLIQHPQIFLPEAKELHYFNHKFNHPLKEYQAYFAGQAEMLRGEVNPDYGCLEKWKIEYLNTILPHLKAILIIRNPIERAWSHAVMSYIKMHNKKPAEITLKDWLRHFKNPLSIKKGNYLLMIKNWSSVYAKDKLKILFYDDLKENPEQFLNEVLSFLELKIPMHYNAYPIQRQFNKGAEIEIPEKALEVLKNQYRKDIFDLNDLLGKPIQKWIEAYNL